MNTVKIKSVTTEENKSTVWPTTEKTKRTLKQVNQDICWHMGWNSVIHLKSLALCPFRSLARDFLSPFLSVIKATLLWLPNQLLLWSLSVRTPGDSTLPFYLSDYWILSERRVIIWLTVILILERENKRENGERDRHEEGTGVRERFLGWVVGGRHTTVCIFTFRVMLL